MQIRFKKLNENASMPIKAYDTDAGFDLTVTEITTELNKPGELILVYHTGIAVEIPEGYFGLLVPRSSISTKTLILCNHAGVIDSHYRGEVTGKFKTTTNVVPSVYKVGDRFAQLLILPVPQVEFVESNELTETDRGEGGYGSTNTVEQEERSAATESQSLPENEVETNNFETATEPAAESINDSEQV